MITLQDFMGISKYEVSRAAVPFPVEFGPDTITMENDSYWYQSSAYHEEYRHKMRAVFNTKTHVCYYAEIADYKNNRGYRILHPNHVHLFKYDRDIPVHGFELILLETDQDFINKATAIVNDESYDSRIELPIDLEKDELHNLMLEAHRRDITLNALITEVLELVIAGSKKKTT